MQYEQTVHQAEIEPVVSGVQGLCLNKFSTESSKIFRLSMGLNQTNHDLCQFKVSIF